MRAEGWEQRLNDAIEAARAQPFRWGQHDCAMFCARVVKKLTGRDLAAAWRGYDTEFGALRLVREAGGLKALAKSVLGEPINANFARRGDVVLIQSDREGWDGALGICVGTHAAFASPDGGLALVPMPQWVTAWRVN